MSKLFKPCLYKNKGLETQWVNNIVSSHDLWCGCCNPFDHLRDILSRDKWHLTKDASTETDPIGKDEKDDFILDDGDLAQLFDIEEKEG